jgi:lipoyltransferase 1
MALRLAKSCAAKWRLSTRCISTVVNEESIEKSVFISQSHDVFTNLALEDWMYKKMDFTKHHVMLLWRNDPCVVIGRHQNPWLEANIPLLEKKGISLARRNSGGGTVYHDRGNLNVTFFMPKQRYNRPNNLQILARALHREWNLKAEINKREDMVIDSTFKVSFYLHYIKHIEFFNKSYDTGT